MGLAAAGDDEAPGRRLGLRSSGDPKVFISYRREETAGHAGRLYDVVSSRFGDANVFMDVDMAPGVDFVNRITQAVGSCHVLLVIIGPRWATISDGGTLGRIFEPGDFVRLEVEEGLRRSGVAVIPVLVGGARMPDPGTLPAPLRALTRRNALELSDTRWRYDIDRLIAALDRLVAPTSQAMPRPPAHSSPERDQRPSGGVERATLAVTTTIVAALAGALGSRIGDKLVKQHPGKGDWKHILNEVGPSGAAWACVLAPVAIWLAWRVRTRHASLGWLVAGGAMGVAAGVGGAAVFALPRYLGKEPADPTKQQLTIVGFALLGAIVGALAGWIWNRRGSVGLIAGLLAGGLYELAAWDPEEHHAFINNVGVAALVIVGATVVAQALLDAWAGRSPRTLASSRGP
jgi:drug/metabolite transporter (DMT)-like permease